MAVTLNGEKDALAGKGNLAAVREQVSGVGGDCLRAVYSKVHSNAIFRAQRYQTLHPFLGFEVNYQPDRYRDHQSPDIIITVMHL